MSDINNCDDEDDDSYLNELQYAEGDFNDFEFDENPGQGVNWRNVDSSNVFFSINEGRNEAKKKADDEVQFLQETVRQLCRKDTIRSVTAGDIIDLFFGKNGALTPVLLEMLPQASLQGVNSFLHMFSLQTLMGKDTKSLYETLRLLDVQNLQLTLSKSDYESMWEGIASSSDASSNRATTRPKPGCYHKGD